MKFIISNKYNPQCKVHPKISQNPATVMLPGVGNRSNGNGGQRQQSVPSVAHRLPYILPPMSHGQAGPRLEENPYESVPVLEPLQRYTSQGRANKDASTWKSSGKKHKCPPPQYGPDYYELRGQEGAPMYTQVADYADTYARPTDRLQYEDSKYSHPVYYVPGDSEQASTGRLLYQAQPDSSFGSDSGYSHHTSGTTGTSGTGTRSSNSRTEHRKDKHRNFSHHSHSADFIVS